MTASRWFRIIASGVIGFGAVAGLLAYTVVALTTPTYTGGCIVMPRPSIAGALVMFVMAALITALLAFARTTNSALIGSLILFGLSTNVSDDFLGPYGALLGAAVLIIGVIAKCVEEFPALQRQSSSKSQSDTSGPGSNQS